MVAHSWGWEQGSFWLNASVWVCSLALAPEPGQFSANAERTGQWVPSTHAGDLGSAPPICPAHFLPPTLGTWRVNWQMSSLLFFLSHNILWKKIFLEFFCYLLFSGNCPLHANCLIYYHKVIHNLPLLVLSYCVMYSASFPMETFLTILAFIAFVSGLD